MQRHHDPRAFCLCPSIQTAALCVLGDLLLSPHQSSRAAAKALPFFFFFFVLPRAQPVSSLHAARSFICRQIGTSQPEKRKKKKKEGKALKFCTRAECKIKKKKRTTPPCAHAWSGGWLFSFQLNYPALGGVADGAQNPQAPWAQYHQATQDLLYALLPKQSSAKESLVYALSHPRLLAPCSAVLLLRLLGFRLRTKSETPARQISLRQVASASVCCHYCVPRNTPDEKIKPATTLTLYGM